MVYTKEITCQYCADRKLNCHSTCEAYKKRVQREKEKREEIFKQLKINETLFQNQNRRIKSLSSQKCSGTKHKGYRGSGSRR